MSQAKSPEKVVQEIRRKTRRQFSAEEKIRIVLEGLRGEESIAAAVSPRRPEPESLLPVEQGVSRSRQEATGGRYDALGARGKSRRARSIARIDHAYYTDAHGYGQTRTRRPSTDDVGRDDGSADDRRTSVL